MLYALPDHQVMESLLPALRDSYIEPAAARQRLEETPGLVPIAIRPDDSGTIYFADIGDEPFLDWKYVYTVERLIRDGKITRFFATDLGILDGPPAVSDGLAPDGLVFHVSRCGSTLFCKALSRLSTNLVINQGGPLQSGFWAAITNGWNKPLAATEQNLNRLRNLVLMMTRRRQRDYRRCFVKFISWNTVYIDFIRAAFPDSRALYLYRDPAEVLSLVLEETTAALHLRQTPLAPVLTGLDAGDIGGLDDVAFLAHCYASYFRAVAEQGTTADSNWSTFAIPVVVNCFRKFSSVDWTGAPMPISSGPCKPSTISTPRTIPTRPPIRAKRRIYAVAWAATAVVRSTPLPVSPTTLWKTPGTTCFSLTKTD